MTYKKSTEIPPNYKTKGIHDITAKVRNFSIAVIKHGNDWAVFKWLWPRKTNRAVYKVHLVLVLLLIGWKTGAGFLRQSISDHISIYLRQSHENCSMKDGNAWNWYRARESSAPIGNTRLTQSAGNHTRLLLLGNSAQTKIRKGKNAKQVYIESQHYTLLLGSISRAFWYVFCASVNFFSAYRTPPFLV